jgi:hypothetical protein
VERQDLTAKGAAARGSIQRPLRCRLCLRQRAEGTVHEGEIAQRVRLDEEDGARDVWLRLLQRGQRRGRVPRQRQRATEDLQGHAQGERSVDALADVQALARRNHGPGAVAALACLFDHRRVQRRAGLCGASWPT